MQCRAAEAAASRPAALSCMKTLSRCQGGRVCGAASTCEPAGRWAAPPVRFSRLSGRVLSRDRCSTAAGGDGRRYKRHGATRCQPGRGNGHRRRRQPASRPRGRGRQNQPGTCMLDALRWCESGGRGGERCIREPRPRGSAFRPNPRAGQQLLPTAPSAPTEAKATVCSNLQQLCQRQCMGYTQHLPTVRHAAKVPTQARWACLGMPPFRHGC